MTHFKVIELFAGVGGFRLGLSKASSDFEVVWGNQWEPSKKVQHAFHCYSTRFNTGIHDNRDISTIRTNEIPDHNILVGGFPCQDYSVARSNAQGLKGKKGVLFWEISRILKEKTPSFALLENVDRLIKSPSKQRGRDFGIMLSALWAHGYGVEWRVVNAAEQGFAQKRRRLFLFLFHSSTSYYQKAVSESAPNIIRHSGFFPTTFPVSINKEKPEKGYIGNLSDDLLKMTEEYSFSFQNTGVMINGSLYTERITSSPSTPTPLKAILESDVDEKYYIAEERLHEWKAQKDASSIERISPSTGFAYRYSQGKMNFPDNENLPGRTILTSEGTKNRSSHVVKDPTTKRLRILTPVECERLNGFPDGWTDTGMTERTRYFCMGNALVVGLIHKMGITLHEIIKSEKQPGIHE